MHFSYTKNTNNFLTNKTIYNKKLTVINLNEETARIKKIMGITEDENIPEVEKTETDEVVEGEIDEDDEGGESAPSSPSMSKWESGVQRGKGNPVDSGTKWESGVQRGKGNPIW